MGYSSKRKTYRVFKRRTQVVEETMHVTFDEFDHDLAKLITKEKEKELEISENLENLNLYDTSIENEKECVEG